jgi:isocitrate lyase
LGVDYLHGISLRSLSAITRLAQAVGSEYWGAWPGARTEKFAAEAEGYTATRHQREVGVGYFDAVAMAISGGKSSTTALSGSTEAAQFQDHDGFVAHAGHDDGTVRNRDSAVTVK